MPCPYLTEVTMVFCRAFPVKKLVPSDRLTTASRCDDEAYCTCPVYRDAVARAGEALRELEGELHPSSTGGKP